MPLLKFEQRNIYESSLVSRESNSTGFQQQCFNSDDQPIPCAPVFNFTMTAIILTVLTVFSSIVLFYVLWRYWRKRAEERRIEEQLRELTILQNQSIREMREAANLNKYKRLPSEDHDNGEDAGKPLPVAPPKTPRVFRKFWK